MRLRSPVVFLPPQPAAPSFRASSGSLSFFFAAPDAASLLPRSRTFDATSAPNVQKGTHASPPGRAAISESLQRRKLVSLVRRFLDVSDQHDISLRVRFAATPAGLARCCGGP